jgi:hypothetical protein
MQMGKTGLFAASATALIVACIEGWAVSDTQARAATSTVRIDPLAMMTSAKQHLPSALQIIPSYSE